MSDFPKFIISHDLEYILHTEKPHRLLFKIEYIRGGEDIELFIQDWYDDPYPEHMQHYAAYEKIAEEAKRFFKEYTDDDENF